MTLNPEPLAEQLALFSEAGSHPEIFAPLHNPHDITTLTREEDALWSLTFLRKTLKVRVSS